MSIQLEIPDSVVEAIRLASQDRKQQLLVELAVALYARGILSFGKARELCDLGKSEFGFELGKRQVSRHYSAEDLKDDIAYARR